MNRRRRALFTLVALALGGLLGFLIVEVAARTIPLVTDKTMIPFREMAGDEAFAPRPSARARTLKGVLEVTNGHGLRDPERALARSANTPPRVALVGDSVVWGFGLETDATIPRRLEALLAEAGTPIEAWTLAHPATNFANHRARYARLAPQVEPDVVIAFVVFNDLLPEATRFRITPQGLLANLKRNAPYPDFVRPYIDRSAAYALSLRALYAWELRNDPELVFDLHNAPHLTRDLGALLDARPIPGAVALVPGRSETPEQFEQLHRVLLETTDARGAQWVDLRETLGVPAREAFMQVTDSTHPNARGADQIARALVPVVTELLRAPEPEP